MRRPKVLLFDFDGTITNSLPAVGAAVIETLKSYGQYDHTLEEMRKCIGPPLSHSFTTFFGLAPEQAVEAEQIYREHHKNFHDRYAPYDGVSDALYALHEAGFRLAVATSKRESSAVSILERLGTYHLFDLVAGAVDGVRSGKAEVIRHVLDTLDASPDEMLMIGDRLYDVEGAAAFGIPTLGVLWGFGTKEELMEAGAFATVETPSEMVEFLLSLDK